MGDPPLRRSPAKAPKRVGESPGRRGERVSSLAVIEAAATSPADGARRELSRFYREFAPEMNAAVVVAEGGGFRAAFVRGVGITLSRLAPRSLPFLFVGSVTEATLILAPHLSPGSGGAEALSRAIHGVRTQVPESGSHVVTDRHRSGSGA